MDIFLSILALLLAMLGIVGCILPVIPGVILSFGGVLFIYFTSFSTLSLATLCLAAVLAVAVTIADFILPGYMTRKMGGSRAGIVGATVGMIVGLLFGGFIGIIVGPVACAYFGEVLFGGSTSRKALRSAWGSFLAFIFGTGLKMAISVWMAWLVAAQIISSF